MSGESDFEKTLASIGGKEKIYLVSDAAERNKASESDADVVREFIDDLFGDRRLLSTLAGGDQRHVCPKGYGDKPPKGTPDNLDSGACPGGTQRTVIRQSSSSSRRRTIDCPAIVFLFRQTFISSELCLKEVLKDVKARTNRASGTLPALIGLVRITAGESDESRRCVQRLEMLIRKVFPQHPADTVWVASFLPGAPGSVLDIKKNVCRVIACSQTTDITEDRENPLLWPFQCLFRSNRGGARGAASSSPTSKRRGDSGSVEENIPLKSNSTSAGSNEQSPGADA
ncbi:uncharacterized protein LOC109519146 [Hippocampus comes]|uniref:uncharacterized protein LOC109519146 n=1 Tax=Hippocampus comes TaxID=109280 RepID=UPI00094E938B|nr:PREDICTED: uncharacterized protein LOC109519146 [Hippocampus comes]